MRRINLIVTVSLTILFLASLTYAADISGSTTIGTTPFTPSNNVMVKAKSIATQFGATSAHLNGNAEYGTCGGSNLSANCDAAKIYRRDGYSSEGTLGNNMTAPETDGSHIDSSWKPL